MKCWPSLGKLLDTTLLKWVTLESSVKNNDKVIHVVCLVRKFKNPFSKLFVLDGIRIRNAIGMNTVKSLQIFS